MAVASVSKSGAMSIGSFAAGLLLVCLMVKKATRLSEISVYPEHRVMNRNNTQQFVYAHYTDG
jgi:hypothetical protein